jgi:RsiW-degrading membrane proteinase PrsW (M82 family)
MAEKRDPVERAADSDADLYDVATWEERSSLDGLSVALYRLLVGSTRIAILLAAFAILLAIGGLSALTDPQIGSLTALSAVPALALAGYVWYSDVTESEPLGLLVATFLLAVLTANFAAVINSLLQPGFGSIGILGSTLFFFVVVGPVEESVKLLAVRLYAYRSSSFDAVVDGAVYGAVAGLGFATIENALYITQQIGMEEIRFGTELIGAGGGVTAIRALAGPGHVIYSGIAGYYLGLAKFNQRNAGPIIVKGIILASVVHATYNSIVGPASALVATFTPLGGFTAFLAFIVVYDGLFGLFLYRKIRRYRDVYRATRDETDEATLESELTEFETSAPSATERDVADADGGTEAGLDPEAAREERTETRGGSAADDGRSETTPDADSPFEFGAFESPDTGESNGETGDGGDESARSGEE